MSERMEQALFDYAHENIHGSLSVSMERVIEQAGGNDDKPRMVALSLEQLAGPIAIGAFHEGMRFALRNPSCALAYVEMIEEGANMDARDRESMASGFAALEAAWRPVQ